MEHIDTNPKKAYFCALSLDWKTLDELLVYYEQVWFAKFYICKKEIQITLNVNGKSQKGETNI